MNANSHQLKPLKQHELQPPPVAIVATGSNGRRAEREQAAASNGNHAADARSQVGTASRSDTTPAAPTETPPTAPASTASPANASAAAPVAPASSSAAQTPSASVFRVVRKWLLLAGTVAALAVAGLYLAPWVETMLSTVSTDDAYVNGHVTFVAPRVAGQVSRVLVDDNMQVKKGDLLVELDKEPYRVEVEIKKAAVAAAESDLAAAMAKVRSLEALARSQRWELQSAMEQVANQVASLRAKTATYESRKATLELSQLNLERGERLVPSGAMSREEFDLRRQTVKVDEAAVKQALQEVYATRVSLGLPPEPAAGHELTEVPPDLEQTFSEVRTALAGLGQTVTQIGLPLAASEATPSEVLDAFRRRNAEGDVDRVLEGLVPLAPAVKQAEARLLQARRDLAQAELDLRYCDVVAEIDGVVTRRNVNPGNNVQAGQSLMAVRSLKEIWIDANFKETQLADLRIGQRVRLEVDMYGRRQEFEGRVTGFTMGTGQTLALLPPQNATGNFVKIVQRLPVRIELINYDPENAPLFVGLSVTPYVYFQEPATGPHAGEYLQPAAPLPQASANSDSTDAADDTATDAAATPSTTESQS